MNRTLFERNADACEKAKRPMCTCHCGGALHGQRHGEEWRDSAFNELQAAEGREYQEDLFDVPENVVRFPVKRTNDKGAL